MKQDNIQRNMNIDALKGFAIILVVIGHIIQFNVLPNDYDQNIIFRYIYAFHMPLFMFISGYLSYNKNRNNDLKWILKKAKQLLIPFFLWILLDYIIKFQFNNMSFFERISNIIINPDNGLWFLLVLFWNCLVLYLVSLNMKNHTIIYIITIIFIFLQPINIIGIGLLKWYIVFFASGYFFSQNKEKLLKYLKKSFIICLILFSITVVFWQRNGESLFLPYIRQLFITSNVDLRILSMINIIYRYIVSFTGIILFFSLFHLFNFSKIKQFLSIFGKYTMQIYILHFYFLQLIVTKYVFMNAILTFLICLIFPIIIFKIVKKNKIIGHLLFGTS